MCRVLKVHPSGYYAWLHKPLSDREIDDLRLSRVIKDSYEASHRVYGYRRIYLDLRETGELIGPNRVLKIMKQHNIKAIRGYKVHKYGYGRPSIVTPNHLKRVFDVAHPNEAWVTDITYIRTWQGWLYLAVVIDLYSRNIVGWSMKPTLAKEIVIDALLMAVWRRKPKTKVLVHS